MNIESGDVVVFKVSDKTYKSRVSKVDGSLVKLIEENGTYRQMPIKNLEDLLEKGFAYLEKHIWQQYLVFMIFQQGIRKKGAECMDKLVKRFLFGDLYNIGEYEEYFSEMSRRGLHLMHPYMMIIGLGGY